jgi:hypothetical protein
MPIEKLEDDTFGVNCPSGRVYRADFNWDLGQLAPGTYTLFFLHTISHPLADGMQACSDDTTGQPLPKILYSGTIIDTLATITITP